MILKINGKPTELNYCQKHGYWYSCDDEMNCCEREKEFQQELEGGEQ